MSREFRQYRFSAPPGATELLVVRHGESEPARLDEPHPVTAERADPPLDPRGRDEARMLAERLGEWEGATFRERIEARDPLAMRMFTEERWDVIPGAESSETFRARVRDGVARIAGAHRDQRVVVVTHGGVIGTIMSLATGARPFALVGADNASISHIVVTENRWLVRRFNDTAHLTTDLDRPVVAT